MTRRWPLLLAIAGAAWGVGCAPARAAETVPAPEVAPIALAWDTARADVERLVGAGRYVAADTLLEGFATRYAGTAQSSDALYWRALLAIDPANPGASPRVAVAAVDTYLARGSQQPQYAEALVLRRTAEAMDALQRQALAAVTAPVTPAPEPAADRARDAEIQRLRTELDRTQAELERLRRRVRP